VTDAAGLVAEPVRIMIHAVVHPTLGTPALLDAVRRAAPAVIAAAESERLRTLALPVLGVDATTAGGEEERYITTLVDEIVGCLRRAERRFDRIVIVCRYQDQQAAVATALNRARERAWTQTG